MYEDPTPTSINGPRWGSGGGTYFDAVITEDMTPVFNGTTEETVKWLKENPSAKALDVCIGKTMAVMPVMRYLALMDPETHARNHQIHELVKKAMREQDTATYEGYGMSDRMERVAKKTTDEIIKLFY